MLEAYLEVTDELELKLKHPALIELDPYRSIIRRDRGSEGDSQGRGKRQAKRELSYIFLVTNIESHFIRGGLEGDFLRQEVRNALDMPEGWEEDELIAEAIRIEERFQGAEVKYARGVLSGLNTSTDAITLIELKLKGIIKKARESEDDMEISAKGIYDNIQNFLKLSKEVGPAIKMVVETLKRARIEVREQASIWGGGTLGNREDP